MTAWIVSGGFARGHKRECCSALVFVFVTVF